jgi:hypothetical protein
MILLVIIDSIDRKTYKEPFEEKYRDRHEFNVLFSMIYTSSFLQITVYLCVQRSSVWWSRSRSATARSIGRGTGFCFFPMRIAFSPAIRTIQQRNHIRYDNPPPAPTPMSPIEFV